MRPERQCHRDNAEDTERTCNRVRNLSSSAPPPITIQIGTVEENYRCHRSKWGNVETRFETFRRRYQALPTEHERKKECEIYEEYVERQDEGRVNDLPKCSAHVWLK